VKSYIREFGRNLPAPVKQAIRSVLGWSEKSYRSHLFDELVAALGGVRPLRILEIGPKDGQDTRRLLTLKPDMLQLIELEDKSGNIDAWYPSVAGPNVALRYGNFMYEPWADELEPFDVVWCAGVLYHNPEQLRMVAKLFDLTRLGGLLVIESATARRRFLRDENCVEIWYPPPDREVKKKFHISSNVSHVPSRKALETWLKLVGFADIRASQSHRNQSRALARSRAAFIARRGNTPGVYYAVRGHNYQIGRSR
jgi:SAM-dependent methyltransferase